MDVRTPKSDRPHAEARPRQDAMVAEPNTAQAQAARSLSSPTPIERISREGRPRGRFAAVRRFDPGIILRLGAVMAPRALVDATPAKTSTTRRSAMH